MHSTHEESFNLLQMNILVECSYSSFFFYNRLHCDLIFNGAGTYILHLHVFTKMTPNLLVCRSFIFIDRNGNPIPFVYHSRSILLSNKLFDFLEGMNNLYINFHFP